MVGAIKSISLKTALLLGALFIISLAVFVCVLIGVVFYAGINHDMQMETAYYLSGIIGIVSLILAGGLYFLGRHLGRRLQALEAISDRIMKGDYEPGQAVHGEDEIAAIAGMVNEVASNMQQYTEMLPEYNQLKHDNSRLSKIMHTLREANLDVSDSLERLQRAQAHILDRERQAIVGKLFVSVCHEFNNSLMSIMGTTELVLDGKDRLSETHREDIRGIHEMAQNIAERLTQLFEFYRPEEEVMEDLKMREVIDHAVELTQPHWVEFARAKGCDISVSVECDDDLRVHGNSQDLMQMLTCIIFNAVEAMPEGGVITIRATENPPGTVSLSVIDTGIGMSRQTLSRCRRPFYSSRPESNGIGLNIAEHVVKQHHGTFDIDSEQGAGTTVYMNLPSESAEVSRTAVLAAPAALDRELMILVVEDDPALLRVLSKGLERDDHTVVAVEGGREALHWLKENQCDVLLTDRAMPEMSGDELATAVKRDYPDLPIVLLTGFGEIMKARGETPPQFDAVVAKPVSFNELRNVIASVVTEPTSVAG